MSEGPSLSLPEELILRLRVARSVTVLTGAGISAESGIPTFRDAQTGLWARYRPEELATPEAFRANPALVMDWYRWRRDLVHSAQPNAGHLALAAMEKHIPRFTLITQNVDGLHQRAGSTNLIELHGSLQGLRCANAIVQHRNLPCDYRTSTWPEEQTPSCPRCGSPLRPEVVWFGEALPAVALQRAFAAARSSEIFFSVGTSGLVAPAAALPHEALRAGATLVEVNPQETALTGYAQFMLPFPAAAGLPALLRAAWPAG